MVTGVSGHAGRFEGREDVFIRYQMILLIYDIRQQNMKHILVHKLSLCPEQHAACLILLIMRGTGPTRYMTCG